MPQIFAFGDSITWGAWDLEGGGWVQRIKSEIDRAQTSNFDFWCPVYNLGISGDTSAGLAARIEAELSVRHREDQVSIVLIAIGINDSIRMLDKSAGEISILQFRAQLEILAQKVEKYTSRMVFLGLNPIDQAKLDPIPWSPKMAMSNARVSEFNQTIQQFAEARKLAFVDIWNLWIGSDYTNLLLDGLHPNSVGHELIYKALRKSLMEFASVAHILKSK